MKLSKRLQTICDLVPENSKVIDVGADHALVDIYLAKTKKCHCLATDVSKINIEKAKQNINKAKANVKTKVTNGLQDISLNDEIIIISGMGSHTILNILNKRLTNDLIICSNNNPCNLRKKLQKRGYRIYKETVVEEKRFYVITYYKYKQGRKVNPYVSPYLISNIGYMRKLLNYFQIKYISERKYVKKIKYKFIVNKIKKYVK